MAISFSDRIRVPDQVLISNQQSESVMLNLQSERYFGLDEVGTRIFNLLTTSASIQAAYELLLAEYDVDSEVLRQDLIEVIEQLSAQGLVEISDE
jgi:hypothetical protein